MKKFLLCIFLFCFLGVFGVYSQDTLRFANSGFEDWINESGYTVHTSPIDANLNFFGGYVRPSEWNRAYYHMNKTITKKVIINITATIDTDVPIHNFSKYTKKVTEGSAAACLSSFQLNDVISSTAIQYGKDNLAGYGLTTDMVCASIISTGNLTRNGSGTYIKQIVNFGLLGCGGEKNEAELYDSIKNYDMNKYVEGGLALNGFYPTRLHGSYMYKSNSASDAGEVILIGTHYDSQAKKRLIVGGGYKNDLNTATTAYEEFDVYYRPFVDVEPDSLVIICMSSGLTNCADESKLYLDDFYLLSDCYAVENLVANEVTSNSAVLSWDENRHLSWEYAYGKKGFNVEEAVPVSIEDDFVELSNLESATEYEFYVRTVCSETNRSEWTKVEFITEESQLSACEPVTNVLVTDVTLSSAVVSWNDMGSSYEVVSGEKDFSFEDVEVISITGNEITLSDLQTNTDYDVYVRNVCSDELKSAWGKVSFTTLDLPTCDAVSELSVSEISQYSATISWDESEFDYEIMYGESGFDLSEAEIIKPTGNSYSLENLSLQTSYDVYVRSVKDGYYDGEWTKVSFTTLDLPTCDAVSELSVSEISQYGATISWGESEFGYELAYGESGFDVAQAEVVKPTTNTYVLENLSLYTAYDVYVRAVKEGYYDGEWTKVSFSTLDLPTCESVAELVVSEVSQNWANVSWAESANNYEIAFGESGFVLEKSKFVTVTENEYTLSDLVMNTAYDMYVRAVNENAYASEWTKIEFTTLDMPTCETVSEVSISDVTTNGAVVSWTSIEEGNTFEIYFGEEGVSIDDAEFLKIETSPYVLANLSANTSYDVYVRAVREGAYNGEWQNVSFVTEKITCAPVSSVEVTAITDTSAIISVPLSEYTYQLVFVPSDEAYDLSQPIVLSDVSYQLNNLLAETSYVVYVRAVKEGYADGEWTKYEFTTKKTEPVIVQVNPVEGLNVIHEDSTYYVVWNDSQYEYEISYGLSGFDIDTAVSYHITGNNYQIPELENGTYDVYVRAVSDENTPSEWQKVSFEYEKKEIVIEPECKFESVVQNIIADYNGCNCLCNCGAVELIWENPETNPQYEWFDVAIYEFAEGMDNTVGADDIQRITNPGFHVSYTEYENVAKELVLYVRVGAEGCESSDWAKYQFTAPTIDVAIDEVEKGNVSVYPTLSDGTFFISFNSQASADVIVYDVNGSIVTKMNNVNDNVSIQLNKKGLFIVEVTLEGVTIVKTVVIYK
ncbi:MAG: fibronectin type III domain-containing protein [Bacteroidales bacterium]|nr:fibronectin type III domain-containing protein [Bacteroidales bacterium]